MFRVEKMRAEDFSFAVQLANTMDWNMAESDFAFNQKLEPEGCFVVWRAHKRVGIATCVSYGRIGWFGNLAVKPEHRRKGAGTCLLEHAVQYLKSVGVETVGLYAYQHLVEFYEKVGFKPQDEFALWSGKAVAGTEKDALTKASERRVAAIIEADSRCLGWNRRKLLDIVLHAKGNLCYYSAKGNELEGFGIAKVYDEMAEIGPLVCRKDLEDVAVSLLSKLLHKQSSLDVYVCVPAKEKILLNTLVAAGLGERFRLTRMFLGPAIAQDCIYVPESLERG